MAGPAIIIVNWNVKDLLRNCLNSLKADSAAGEPTAEVWVVDNASHDGSVEMVRQEFPEVHLIAGEKNMGFAGGNNAALRALGFDRDQTPASLPEAVLLLNPDTEVHPGALQTLFNFLRHTPQAGMAGARLLYGDGSFQHSAFAFPGLWQLAIELLPLPGRLAESRLNGRYSRALYEGGRPFKIGHPLGAALAVKREAIEQCGLLDEAYPMYVEEVDWCKRMTRAGWAAYCVPQAMITHLGGQSTGQIKTDMFITLWRSRYRFYRRHYGRVKVWLAQQIVRQGMRRLAAQDNAATRRGEITPAQAAEREDCYRQVARIWQERNQ